MKYKPEIRNIRTPFLIILAVLFITVGFTTQAIADVSGNIFRDYNADGINDTNESLLTGVAGITVTAYDDDNAVVGSATVASATGSYLLSTTGTGPFRIEFAGLPSWLDSTAAGSDNGTTVQFVNDGGTANLGVMNSADFCSGDATLAVSCFENGDGTGSNNTSPAFVTWDYDATATDNKISMGITIADVGSTWGQAYQRETQYAFKSTFLKRHVGILDGPGYVYVSEHTTPASPTMVTSFNLQGVVPANGGSSIDLGSVCRDATCANNAGNTGIAADYVLGSNPTNPNTDLDAFGKVGVIGFGDIDLTQDEQKLFLVNLHQRALISIDVSDASNLPGAVNQHPVESLSGYPSCATNSGTMRPFALDFKDGVGYLGTTCDAAVSQNAADLAVYVLAFDPSNVAAGFTTFYSLTDLTYTRANSAYYNPSHLVSVDWAAWANSWADTGHIVPTSAVPTGYAQPIFSDIEFDDSGNLILTLMDRFAHQGGNHNATPVSGNTDPYIRTRNHGDTIRACWTGSTFELEGTGSCSASVVDNRGGQGVSNTGFEFFDDVPSDDRNEATLGALAVRPGSGEIIAPAYDPFPINLRPQDPNSYFTNGIYFFDDQTGLRTDWYRVFGDGTTDETQQFAKGSGLGDIEVWCTSAPLEIGNYIWEDTDGDGIQDPGEAPIANVDVTLTGPGVSVTTTTNANGEYYFNDDNVGSSGLSTNTDYTLSIDLSQTELSSYELTTANVNGGSSSPDKVDSDATENDGNATITLVTGAAGENDHSFDFGFKPKVDLSLVKTVDNASPKRGDTVNYTITVTNSSIHEATGVEVQDLLPSGISYFNHSGGTYDNNTGIWDVGSVAANGGTQTLVITVTVD